MFRVTDRDARINKVTAWSQERAFVPRQDLGFFAIFAISAQVLWASRINSVTVMFAAKGQPNFMQCLQKTQLLKPAPA